MTLLIDICCYIYLWNSWRKMTYPHLNSFVIWPSRQSEYYSVTRDLPLRQIIHSQGSQGTSGRFQNYPSNVEASRFATAAKNALKTTLIIARDATAGLPLPVQGVIGAVVNIIQIAEVISSWKILRWRYSKFPSKQSLTRSRSRLWTTDAELLSILWSIR